MRNWLEGKRLPHKVASPAYYMSEIQNSEAFQVQLNIIMKPSSFSTARKNNVLHQSADLLTSSLANQNANMRTNSRIPSCDGKQLHQKSCVARDDSLFRTNFCIFRQNFTASLLIIFLQIGDIFRFRWYTSCTAFGLGQYGM